MIEIIKGDITQLEVDAIVNAVNPQLIPGGGVDGAIRRAAGHSLNEALERLDGCPVGEARLTNGFNLSARYVIHTAGPVWQGGEQGEPEQLRSCYRAVLKMAMDRDIQSIAFPCISTGVYGYPKGAAAMIAFSEIQQLNSHFSKVVICCYSDEDAKIYQELVARH